MFILLYYGGKEICLQKRKFVEQFLLMFVGIADTFVVSFPVKQIFQVCH